MEMTEAIHVLKQQSSVHGPASFEKERSSQEEFASLESSLSQFPQHNPGKTLLVEEEMEMTRQSVEVVTAVSKPLVNDCEESMPVSSRPLMAISVPERRLQVASHGDLVPRNISKTSGTSGIETSDESGWETMASSLQILVPSPVSSPPPPPKPRKSSELLRKNFPSPISEDHNLEPSPTCTLRSQVAMFNASVWEGDVTSFSPNNEFESTRAFTLGNIPPELEESESEKIKSPQLSIVQEQTEVDTVYNKTAAVPSTEPNHLTSISMSLGREDKVEVSIAAELELTAPVDLSQKPGLDFEMENEVP